MIQSKKIDTYLESFIVIDLSVVCLSIFFMPPYDKNVILVTSILSLIALFVWCLIRVESLNSLSNSLVILLLLFILYLCISGLTSRNQWLSLMYLMSCRFFILSRLLYVAPLQDEFRRSVIVVLFISAAVAGLVGFLQYIGIMQIVGDRAYGFSLHPITYACTMAVAYSSAVIMLFIPSANMFTSKKGLFFLLFVVFLTFCGVILSKTRGVWVALLIAPAITILLHNRRKAIIYLLAFVAIFTIITSSSNALKARLGVIGSPNISQNNEFKERISSIVTSAYEEDVTGSTGNRLQLWKGALLIFKEYPILGSGLGDFELNIRRLIYNGKLNPGASASLHAHNIYLQALATVGIIGFALMIALVISLMKWGIKLIREHGEIGGYILILNTVLCMIIGLTYSPLGDAMYIAASCLVIGLAGPYGTGKAAAKFDFGTEQVIS